MPCGEETRPLFWWNMCGIVAYIGKRDAAPILIDGLRRLEYRGYDSAGIALLEEDRIFLERAMGKVNALADKLEPAPKIGRVGIAHTRWATHGVPNELNAHPHTDCTNRIALVHNGIIENHWDIRKELVAQGHVFRSETDTEVLVHLIEESVRNAPSLRQAVQNACSRVHGTYGIAVISSDHPNTLVAARHGSPLIIGVGKNEYIVASDASAVIEHTRKVIYLQENETVEIDGSACTIVTSESKKRRARATHIAWELDDVEKNGQPHFMLKEMLDQPDVVKRSWSGRARFAEKKVIFEEFEPFRNRWKKIKRIRITGCGSAYYAGLFGKHMIETWAHIPVDVDVASELRYQPLAFSKDTAVLAISQSGETADTLAALREAQKRGSPTFSIVNVVGSTIARETMACIYNQAGPELGVASTKAFISQCVVLSLFAAWLGTVRGEDADLTELMKAIEDLPKNLFLILDHRETIQELAKRYSIVSSMLYLGRSVSMPMAFEGALKLKEVSYIHAEAYAAGEMKHGPIALIEPLFPTIAICPHDAMFEKMVSTIQEIRARSGPVIALTTPDGEEALRSIATDVIVVPKTHEHIQPILGIVPLQLFAYYVAVAKGFDPDKPRNLAKSVTVE